MRAEQFYVMIMKNWKSYKYCTKICLSSDQEKSVENFISEPNGLYEPNVHNFQQTHSYRRLCYIVFSWDLNFLSPPHGFERFQSKLRFDVGPLILSQISYFVRVIDMRDFLRD